MEQTDLAGSNGLPLEMLHFTLAQVRHQHLIPRLGSVISGKKRIPTPNYVVPTSRGVVPHLTPDLLQRHTKIGTVYVALEDCMSSTPSYRSGADLWLTDSG